MNTLTVLALGVIFVLRPVYTVSGYFENHLEQEPNAYDVNNDGIVNWQDFAILERDGRFERR